MLPRIVNPQGMKQWLVFNLLLLLINLSTTIAQAMTLTNRVNYRSVFYEGNNRIYIYGTFQGQNNLQNQVTSPTFYIG